LSNQWFNSKIIKLHWIAMKWNAMQWHVMSWNEMMRIQNVVEPNLHLMFRVLKIFHDRHHWQSWSSIVCDYCEYQLRHMNDKFSNVLPDLRVTLIHLTQKSQFSMKKDVTSLMWEWITMIDNVNFIFRWPVILHITSDQIISRNGNLDGPELTFLVYKVRVSAMNYPFRRQGWFWVRLHFLCVFVTFGTGDFWLLPWCAALSNCVLVVGLLTFDATSIGYFAFISCL
jgi:hypothetical protein